MTVLVDIHDGVARLTLARPERLNALTSAMLDDLLGALRRVSIDPKVRCVLLTGAGRGFCAGHDLSEGGEGDREPTLDEAAAQMMLQAQIPILLRRMPKPTIAAIAGPAAGSGFVFAAACDLRIAGRSARFKLAFASAGRCGDPGGAFLLTRLVGSARARELFLLDPLIDAERAVAIGIVSEVVEDEALADHCTQLAMRLAEGPTGAFAAMKRNLNAAESCAFEEVMAAEGAANAQASLAHDGKEAARAFIEKRPPRFRGY